MRTALQDADIRNVLANTFTPYDLVKALLLPSRPPEKPQLPRIGEILALCGIEVPELAGQRGELALPPEIWCHTFGFVSLTLILCPFHICALYLVRLLRPFH